MIDRANPISTHDEVKVGNSITLLYHDVTLTSKDTTPLQVTLTAVKQEGANLAIDFTYEGDTYTGYVTMADSNGMSGGYVDIKNGVLLPH